MAARNPASFTTWIDETLLEPGNSILAATPDSVLNDQVYCLDAPRLIVATTCSFVTSTDAALTNKFIFYVKNKDMCDVDTVTNDEITCDVYFQAYCTDVNTSGQVRFTSSSAVANTTATAAVPLGTTTATWFQTDTMNIKTNDNEDTIVCSMNRTAGSGDVRLLAFSIMAQGT
jgi:hypothetical protein